MTDPQDNNHIKPLETRIGIPESLSNLADEMLECVCAGETVHLDDYCKKHPKLAKDLRELFPTIEAVASIRQASVDEGTALTAELRRLGDYRLLRELGRGGMGVVYEAEQISLGRRVAVKIMPMAALLDTRHLERFKNEARAAAMLKHPNIVSVHSVGSERGVHYYAMELIEGQSLAEIIAEIASGNSPQARAQNSRATGETQTHQRQKDIEPESINFLSSIRDTTASANSHTHPIATLSTQRSADRSEYVRNISRLGARVAEALDYAHRQGVVHRDIKPSNILLDSAGEPQITDFGLARVEGGGELTMTGDLVGTVRYMSPEQASGRNGRIDDRTDVYSLGITLYELLALQPAFHGDDRGTLLSKIENVDAIQLRKIDKTIPKDLETIISKSMEKEPHHRYETAKEFAEDLSRFVEQRPVKARRQSRFYYARRWTKRNRGLAVALATILALLSFLAISGPFVAVQQARMASETRHQLYAQDINVVVESMKSGNIKRATELLNEYENNDDGHDQSFEWRYLRKYCERASTRATIDAPRPAFVDGGLVRSVAFSPDDSALAIGYWGHMARTVDAGTGEELRRMKTIGKVRSVAFSPDGHFLAVGTEVAEVRLWNVATGWKMDEPLPGVRGEVWSVAISPDGDWLATTDNAPAEMRTLLWSLNLDGQRISVGEPSVLPHDEWILQVRFFPKSDLLTTVATDGIRIWNTQTHQLKHFQPRTVPCKSVAVAPNEQTIAVGRSDGIVETLKLSAGRLTKSGEIVAHESPVENVDFRPGSNELLSMDNKGRLSVWNIESAALTRAAINDDYLLQNWDQSGQGAEVVTMPTQWGHARGMGVSHDGKRVATGSFNGSVSVINFRETIVGGPRRLVHAGDDHWTVRFTPDGKKLLSVGEHENQNVRIWDLKSGTYAETEAQGYVALDVSPDGRLGATGIGDTPYGWKRPLRNEELRNRDYSGTVEIFDVNTGKLLDRLTGHKTLISSVRFSPVSGAPFVSACLSGIVKLWDATTFKEIGQLPRDASEVYCIDVSPNAKRLAVCTSGTIEVWDIESPAKPVRIKTLYGHEDWVGRCRFSSDGSLLATGSFDSTARIWDMRKLKSIHELDAGTWVLDVDFSPDGRTLAVATKDGNTQLWNVATGKQLLVLEGHAGAWAMSLAFSPDGNTLATGSLNRSIILWSTDDQMPLDATRLATPFR